MKKRRHLLIRGEEGEEARNRHEKTPLDILGELS